jgi:hypothetical protein
MRKRLILLPLIVMIAACSGKTIIRSEPPTAFVTINGVSQGVTPLEVKLQCRDVQEYEVVVFLPGFLPQSQTVACRRIRGPYKNIFFELEPGQAPAPPMEQYVPAVREEFGYVAIKSIPSGSEVFLNNTFIGTTPVTTQKIKGGYYLLEIRKSGFKPWRKEIQVLPEAEKEFFPILEEQ